MGVLCKVVDLMLLLTFLTVTVVAPVLDTQVYFPQSMFPNAFVSVYKWYTTEHQDYLLVDKPHFFTALAIFELIFQFPLALLNIYGLLTSKPWFNTTCIIFGASLTAILGELMGSEKSSDKLVMMYSPFWGFSFASRAPFTKWQSFCNHWQWTYCFGKEKDCLSQDRKMIIFFL
ncbi:hypothetical protein DITRI_Ditri12bG0020500 [Diplodiscus trichospermus]